MDPRGLIAIAVSIAFVVGISVGVLIGWFSGPDRVDPQREADPTISKRLMDLIDNVQIDENLKYLTSDPHVAGRPRQHEIAQWVRDQYIKFGFDEAEIFTYNVLLSYPSEVPGEENVIQRLVPDGGEPDGYRVEYQSQIDEPALDETAEGKDVLPPFNAYSATGTVEGELVYANYGRVEDFFHLEREKGINLTDKIVIARYGKLFRGDKAKYAADFGAKGIILYSDPADYTVTGEPVYPDGKYLPPTGTQRGSCIGGLVGDPLTPGYPSVDSAYRSPEEKTSILPTIPIHPIPSKDAIEFLKLMDGEDVQKDWKGDMNVTYKYGPGFASPNENNKVRMKISTHNEKADTWTVIGTIRGSVEPDRYVIMGNHIDAWAFGAIDPSSGTAAVLEVARAFGELTKTGWRPRRTIIFGSWGSEEYGLIGSYEWVEVRTIFELTKNLDRRAVAYLNMDVAVSGTFVPYFASTPNLYRAIREATKLVPDPNPDDLEGDVTTLYDRWLARAPFLEDGEPYIADLGSGSDFTAFLQVVGMSASDVSFVDDRALGISPYPMYHSVYETYKLVKTYYDPDFYYHQAAARAYAEIMRNLAESIVLPLNCLDYANKIDDFFKSLRDGDTGQKMINDGGLSFDHMEQAVNKLVEAATTFQEYIENEVDYTNLYQIRAVNDQLMSFERAFIDPLGLPDRPTTRHVIFAPSTRDKYSSDKFAGIVDTMFDIDNNPDPDKWEYVAEQLAAVTYALQSAAYSLKIIT
ncbi:Glutamate carboxypeptidase 2 [Holothuria leucospilota]|uniref:Aminopeptidase NAALADL1 n=1 Tax=Holothuria leucospilota TaxID=206669 RepID=A0A9Q1CMV5_HOLLE|nr:Glutamate carboxypeptidase 2 [Holothuria leucospilota]